MCEMMQVVRFEWPFVLAKNFQAPKNSFEPVSALLALSEILLIQDTFCAYKDNALFDFEL